MRKSLKLQGLIISVTFITAMPFIKGSAADKEMGGGYAASGQLETVGYTTEIYDATNGLPTSDANYILGSSDGYVWIGSYSGIIRYDGSRFERLDTSDGLTSGRAFLEDSLKRIWIGTNDNGVVVIDGHRDIHITYKDGLPSSSIRSFCEDDRGLIYIGSTAGVCYVDKDMNVKVVDDARINNERILRLEKGPGNIIYGHCKNCIFSIENGTVKEYYTSENLGITEINTILPDCEDPSKLYLGTNNKIYYGKFGDRVGNLKAITVNPLESVHWLNFDCGRIWVSSSTQIGYLDENENFHILNRISMNNAIEMVTSDYQGNMWAASSTQGVMKIVANNFLDLTASTDLTENVVNATFIRNGELYVGTNEGLQILDSEGHRITNELTGFIGNSRVRCINSDIVGNIWITTFDYNVGLICYRKDGEIKTFTTENGMPSNQGRCVICARDGSVLVGTNGGLAVIRDGEVVRCVDASSGIKNTVFLTLEEGEKGEIYAGTDGDGMYMIDGDKIRTLGRDDGLTSDVIMRIKWDADKKVYWIVTSNSLEYMINGNIVNVSSFPYNNNYDVYFDDKNNLWVLSSYGVYCVDKDALLEDRVTDYRLYTIANGITSTPTSNAYSAQDDEGYLYIAGRTGVSKVNINHIFEGEADFKLGVQSITLNNNPIIPDETGTYTIAAQSGRIQITPAVFDYTMSNPIVRVFLDGADDDGITTERSKLSSLEYTGLKYGTYDLHIQILDEATKEVLQDAVYKIVKKPRWTELMLLRIIIGAVIAIVAGVLVWRIMTGTVIRRQYNEIKQARDEAERANSAKTRFLANMSHEIRTPINTIMGMDEMILREDATDVPQGYFMSMVNYALDIRSASESLLGLINDLLDMSKIESGKMHLVEVEYDVMELLRSLVSMIKVRSAQKDLTFEVVVDEIMPKRLYGDSGKIKQILLNLLTNAVKYTETGGFTLNASMEERTDDICYLKFSVKDTGIGVKEEDMEKLFSAYERLDEEKNSGIQGTGLGLDISRRFAEIMGGKLWCESVYGEGSEFIFTLSQKIIDPAPLGKFTEQDASASTGPYVPQFVAPDADILVVDDNSMNLGVIRGLLKSTKMFVTTASSGEECLEKLKDGNFNVVLLDHMMPGMDGIETLARIRETHPDLPVYALTANATAGEEFYVSKGFNGYLAKPIDSLTLEKTIMKHLPKEIMLKAVPDDAPEELTEIPEDMLWVNDVEGLSVDSGIKNSGGISGFFNSIRMFYDTLEANAKVIEDAYKAGDIKLFTVKVHALKTSARIVGATVLSKLAADLEEAGNKGDLTYIDENEGFLIEGYRAFKEKFARIDKESDDSDKEPIPEDELLGAYEALNEVIPQMDYDSVEMILNQLGEYKLPDEDKEIIKELDSKLKALDWDAMEEIIRNKTV